MISAGKSFFELFNWIHAISKDFLCSSLKVNSIRSNWRRNVYVFLHNCYSILMVETIWLVKLNSFMLWTWFSEDLWNAHNSLGIIAFGFYCDIEVKKLLSVASLSIEGFCWVKMLFTLHKDNNSKLRFSMVELCIFGARAVRWLKRIISPAKMSKVQQLWSLFNFATATTTFTSDFF